MRADTQVCPCREGEYFQGSSVRLPRHGLSLGEPQSYSSTRIRASRAISPGFPGKARTGLRSTSRIWGNCSINWESKPRARLRLSRSAGGRPRVPARIRPTRVSAMRSRAWAGFRGATRRAISSRISVSTPPAPKATTGPKESSRRAPSSSSMPPATWDMTTTCQVSRGGRWS